MDEHSKQMGKKIREKVEKERKRDELKKQNDNRYEDLKERVGELQIGEACIITTIGGKKTVDRISLDKESKERIIERVNKPSIEIPVIIINGKASDVCIDMLQKLTERDLKILASPEGFKIDKIIVNNK